MQFKYTKKKVKFRVFYQNSCRYNFIYGNKHCAKHLLQLACTPISTAPAPIIFFCAGRSSIHFYKFLSFSTVFC